MRRPLRLLLAVGFVLTGVVSPVQAVTDQAVTDQAVTVQAVTDQAAAGFVAAINDSRAGQELGPLVVNDELAGVAQAWAQQMRDAGRLSHNPAYAQQYTGQWTRMGENVGMARGGDADALAARVHQAFLDSPGHRANIMGDYNQVGVGVAVDGSTLWVTVNFLQGPVPADPPTTEAPPTVAPQPEPPASGPGHYTRG